MKRILLSFLLLACFITARSQWYDRKYNVSSVSQLSTDKLIEARHDLSEGVIIFGFTSAIGAAIYALAPRYHEEEDSELLFRLLGERGTRTFLKGLGTVVFVSSSVTALVYSARLSSVKRELRYRTVSQELKISPSLLFIGNSSNISPGLTLSITF